MHYFPVYFCSVQCCHSISFRLGMSCHVSYSHHGYCLITCFSIMSSCLFFFFYLLREYQVFICCFLSPRSPVLSWFLSCVGFYLGFHCLWVFILTLLSFPSRTHFSEFNCFCLCFLFLFSQTLLLIGFVWLWFNHLGVAATWVNLRDNSSDND